ncbi:hypothetical protein SAMN05421737_10231 [Shouchella lonarensis]|uniref:Uncharacterized protein n=1 Tax=Shouchella lonarensis TaxID=1464122 RepID=A0A1G6GU96_9BACI|nr:hypothetical protein SAMN05421737_10231 [Shouchella lonarensis]
MRVLKRSFYVCIALVIVSVFSMDQVSETAGPGVPGSFSHSESAQKY